MGSRVAERKTENWKRTRTLEAAFIRFQFSVFYPLPATRFSTLPGRLAVGLLFWYTTSPFTQTV
jgi:hypothetical protein